ncbi:MAG: sulfite exporter TauE/SafE family protein [Planctomycetes bacterium]|nr:sulfite exporter TauE/SafE family protein [Planctomycetota bacterium]
MPAIPKRLWLTGIVSGVVSGMLGVGGGLVLGPALLLLGLPLRRATGTALALIPFVALVAVVAELYLAPQNINFLLATMVVVGGFLGVKLGAALYTILPDKIMHYLFVALVVGAAVRNIYSGSAVVEEQLVFSQLIITPWHFVFAALFGVFAGTCAVLFGVGGGVIVVPALIITIEGLNFQSASAISLVAMIPTTSIAAHSAYRQHRIDIALAKVLAWVCLPAAMLGVVLRNFSLSHQQLQLCFAAFLLYVALRMFRRGPTPGT